MREIKFRAWDKVRKHWLSHRETIELVYEWNGSYEIDDYVIVQYTGLKDMNGVKIYEGDIIELPDTQYRRGGHFQVFQFAGCYVASSLLFKNNESANKHNLSYLLLDDNVRVIGNIYENSELL